MCSEVCLSSGSLFFVFFFQAEDGIRDYKVTGVQTCALPIWDDTLAAGRPLLGVPDFGRAGFMRCALKRGASPQYTSLRERPSTIRSSTAGGPRMSASPGSTPAAQPSALPPTERNAPAAGHARPG